MSDAARRIARAIQKQSGKAKQPGETKLGLVVDVSPVRITPLGGAVSFSPEALVWSNTALSTRDDWVEGDTVVLSMLEGGMYLVHDVVDTGTLLGGAGGGGVTDHGALTGLADDDHTQYHNDARGDARYSPLGHAHTGTYQPLDADLTTIAALDSGTSTGVMATEAAGWVKRTYAQVKTSLGLVKGDVGLGNVDNTSDANKPVSTAQQTALDMKADITSVVSHELLGFELSFKADQNHDHDDRYQPQIDIVRRRSFMGM